jgi:hypothetical protein
MVQDSVNKKYYFYLKYSKYGTFTLHVILSSLVSQYICACVFREFKCYDGVDIQ